ncbi:hypothetical protein IWQ55_000318 [Labrenzia sp. EL_208]|nr:hypothetical protein [Labrenzia sp. EL_132]MBG6227126.1 hypothetical protein [Labrenzia sp. EL_208]
MADEKREPPAGTARHIRIPTPLWDDLKLLARTRGHDDASRLIRFEMKKVRDGAKKAREI